MSFLLSRRFSSRNLKDPRAQIKNLKSKILKFLLIHAARQKPAIHCQYFPIYKTRGIRSEKHRSPSAFVGRSETARRGPRQDLLIQRHTLYRLGKISLDPARQNGIYLNVVRCELNREGFRQLHNRPLGSTIRRRESRAKERVCACKVDDLAGVTIGHRLRSVFGEQEARSQVDLDDSIPIVWRKV